MTIQAIKKKVKKLFDADITVETTDRSVILNGQMSHWQNIVKVGKMFAKVQKGKHIVNEITLLNSQPKPPYVPSLCDKSLEGLDFDVVVVGGGIVGCAILRELSKYNLNILLVEKHSDLAKGASGANDGMVHAGLDIKRKCKKLTYGTRGNPMFDQLCSDLDVPFERNGQYVVFPSKLIMLLAHTYLLRAKRHNIKGVKMLSKKQIDAIEPTVKSYSKGAMMMSTTGAVSPYKLTIALAENAATNGAHISLNTYVSAFEKADGKIAKIVTNRGTFTSKVVINAAGVFADKIAEFADDKYFSIHPRKGSDILLDINGAGLPKNNISLSPTLKTLKENKHTKGGGIVKTVDGNILLGPDAVETPEREDTSTTQQSIDRVFNKQKMCCPSMQKGDIIAYFAGIRACTYEEDFIIETSTKVANLIHVAGIQSPGITAAPAIAVDVQKMAIDLLKLFGHNSQPKEHFEPKRFEIRNTTKMTDSMLDSLVKEDSDFGKIICRCEEISLGEIKQALTRPIVVPTVDGVKRRTRAGMGRCQGGFCQPLVVKAISDICGLPIEQVTKGNLESNLFFGTIKSPSLGDNNAAEQNNTDKNSQGTT